RCHGSGWKTAPLNSPRKPAQAGRSPGRQPRQRSVRQHATAQFDHRVGGQARPGGRPADRVSHRRLVQAVRLSLVSRQEGVNPAHALLFVDPVNPVGDLGRCLEILGEAAFDQKYRHNHYPLINAPPPYTARPAQTAPYGAGTGWSPTGNAQASPPPRSSRAPVPSASKPHAGCWRTPLESAANVSRDSKAAAGASAGLPETHHDLTRPRPSAKRRADAD